MDGDLERAAGIMLVESEGLTARFPGLLDQLPPKERAEVLAISHAQTYGPNQLLFSQGDTNDGIFQIVSGRIRSFYIAPSGREITLAYWFPGNFIGAPDMFGNSIHMWCSAATQRSELIYLPGVELRQLALKHPALGVALIEILSFKARCYSAMAQMLGTRSATERLEQLLLYLANVYGIREGDETVIAASFTPADLANLVGSSRQWVAAGLARLQKERVIRYNRGLIVVRDPSRLGRELG